MGRGALRFVALFAALACLAAGGALAKPEVGKPAPPFSLKTVSGEKVTLEGLRGQVVIINYWATWCVPCLKELPLLDGYYQATAKHGLRVFAITTEDSVPLNRSPMKKLVNALNISVVRRMQGRYGIMKAVPTNYVIDRAGTVRYAKAGAFDLDELNAVVIPLLNEPAPAPLAVPAATAH